MSSRPILLSGRVASRDRRLERPRPPLRAAPGAARRRSRDRGTPHRRARRASPPSSRQPASRRIPIALDVRDPASVDARGGRRHGGGGRIDILINNAGVAAHQAGALDRGRRLAQRRSIPISTAPSGSRARWRRRWPTGSTGGVDRQHRLDPWLARHEAGSGLHRRQGGSAAVVGSARARMGDARHPRERDRARLRRDRAQPRLPALARGRGARQARGAAPLRQAAKTSTARSCCSPRMPGAT